MKYLGYSVEDFLADESFINYLNDSNTEDVALWKKILSTYPQITSNVNEATELYLQLSLRRSNDERAKQLERLKLNLPKEVEEASADKPNYRNTQLSLWLSMAAALVFVIGGYLLLIKTRPADEVLAFTADADDYTVLAETSLGERRTINLPDGSTVTLNGSSILSISKSYNQETRVLKLSGEAFFEVAKDKSKPFMVIANNSVTTALGTSFKVKNYSKEQDRSVMLATGKVSVKELNNNKIVDENLLLPGEQVKLFDYKKSVKSDFDKLSLNDWKEKNLNFSMANITEIKQRLYEMYGVTIIIDNVPAKSQVFTGQFAGENLTNVLDAISFVNHFDYKIKENNVYITYH